MTSPEYQPHQDPLIEARTYNSFDSWLSSISEERLRQMHAVSAQAYGDDGAKDTATLTAIVGISMLFSGKQALSVEDVTQSFDTLVRYLALEVHIREGNVTKKGVFSMVPAENTA